MSISIKRWEDLQGPDLAELLAPTQYSFVEFRVDGKWVTKAPPGALVEAKRTTIEVIPLERVRELVERFVASAVPPELTAKQRAEHLEKACEIVRGGGPRPLWEALAAAREYVGRFSKG